MPFAEFSGIKMHYETEGTGEPVFLVTGYASDCTNMWSMMKKLAASGYTAIVFDNRGVGTTECSNDFGPQDLVDDLRHLMDSLGIAKAHVLGWSMGSQISMEFTLQNQERVQSLTLVSAYERVPARSSFIMSQMLDACDEGSGMDHMFAMLLTMGKTEDYFLSRRGKGIALTTFGTPESIRTQLKCLDTYDLRGKLGGIKVPTLSVHGLDDTMVIPRYGDEVADHIGCEERIRIPNMSHIVNASAYFDGFLAFLKRHLFE